MNWDFFDSKEWLTLCGDSIGVEASIGRIYVIPNYDAVQHISLQGLYLILDSRRKRKESLYIF